MFAIGDKVKSVFHRDLVGIVQLVKLDGDGNRIILVQYAPLVVSPYNSQCPVEYIRRTWELAEEFFRAV